MTDIMLGTTEDLEDDNTQPSQEVAPTKWDAIIGRTMTGFDMMPAMQVSDGADNIRVMTRKQLLVLLKAVAATTPL